MGINPSLQSRKVLIMQGVLELYGLLFQTQFPFIVVCVERNTRIGERDFHLSFKIFCEGTYSIQSTKMLCNSGIKEICSLIWVLGSPRRFMLDFYF